MEKKIINFFFAVKKVNIMFQPDEDDHVLCCYADHHNCRGARMETDYEITNDQTGTVLKTDITCPNIRFKRVIGSSRLNCCEDILF